ncbi:DNA repair protein [Trypanosoma conorhini]|uniref:DNA repair protein n=1 Tax=Trypanosoma conorhini TaxID=83891 RepID=A0A3R7L9I8_9TRYP|nr:DNA repair protein [Trypanosoma conorhini]RNF09768.1 DNA repair protein [Trypanosoma conorhini]
MQANGPLAVGLQRLLPGLPENATEGALVDALLRCCQEWGVTAEAELLLLLTSDLPFVQRRITTAVQRGQRRQSSFHAAEVQHFLQQALLSLSRQHLLQKHGLTSFELPSVDAGLAAISRSVEDLLFPPDAEGLAPVRAMHDGAFCFTTGCLSLDRLLSGSSCVAGKGAYEGGFRAGFLSELYGEAGSGKTQLVLQSLLQCVAEHLCEPWTPSATLARCPGGPTARGATALYIVSEDFPAARLAALAAGAVKRAKQKALRLSSHLPPATVDSLKASLEDSVTVRAVLTGLHIRRVGTLGELVRLLRDGTLSRAFHALGGRGMVAVDSIAGAAAAGGGGDELAVEVMLAGTLLKTFALRENAAVLVTNQVRAVLSAGAQRRHGGREAVVPALGIQWSLAPHVRIHLQRLQGAGGTTHRQLIVLSGPSNPPVCGGYTIDTDGIRGDS